MVDEIVTDAVSQLHDRPEREKKDNNFVEDVVKAVVHAMIPVMTKLVSDITSAAKPLVTEKVCKALQDHENKFDEQEQYSKKDNIIIRGVPERKGESTNNIVCKIAQAVGVECTEKDISTSHRLGASNTRGGRPRPIVARFVRRDMRTVILRKKRDLKNTTQYGNVYIDEHLTSIRAKLVKALRNDNDIKSVWTTDGKIICTKITDPEKKISVTYPDDLFSKLKWSEKKMRASQIGINLG